VRAIEEGDWLCVRRQAWAA